MKTNKIMKSLFGAVSILLVVSGFAVNATAQSAARILFVGNGTLSSQRNAVTVKGLFAMNPDGYGLVQLSNDPNAINPVWSPGQNYIAYQEISSPPVFSTIYIMDAIGTLHGGRAFPVVQRQAVVPGWSPDGTMLVFATLAAYNFNLYTVAVDPAAGTAGTPVPFVVDAPHSQYEPSWSPDGTRIAFERTTSSSTSAIFTRDVSTGVEVQMPAPFAGVMMVPSWSPDSTQIAFLASGTAGSVICLVNADGTNLRVLPSYPKSGGVAWPTWSPDGKSIALQVVVPTGKKTFQSVICRQDLATGAFTVLTPLTLSAAHPNWAP